MANAIRSLVLNITASGVWTQLKEEIAGTAYTVPSTGHADVKALIVQNLGANSVVIDFAISTDGTITDIERAMPGCTLATGEHAEYEGVIVVNDGRGVWMRCTGTTPNVSVRIAAFEVVP